MQVYRFSQARADSILIRRPPAVRLVHKPTGLVVACQTERSQLQNRETSMKMLRSKLMQIKEQEHLSASPTSRNPAEDRVGQPDPFLCVYALPAGEG